ncbi:MULTISPECIES: LacI family DNA-binding transcriptional regulator [Brevibacterium]|nr:MULTISPECIES: LacI family DNA-binding transcriptional regulator [Brevibacterium]
MHPTRRPTIRDLAKAAGVSPTTVSHALNRKGNVSSSTIQRIERIAAEINYRPSEIARGLQQPRMGILALVMRPLASLDTFLPNGVDYFIRIIGAASLAAMERNYTLMFVDDPSKPGAPFGALTADAYIVTEPVADDPVLSFLAHERKPFVCLGADPARPQEFAAIVEDASRQVDLVYSHLTEAGAKRIALVTGTDENQWNLGTTEAARSWYRDHGQETLVLAVPEVEGEAAGERILGHFDREKPDAFYCLMGRHATGVVRAAQSRGLRVPEDLLVAAGSGTIQNRTDSPSITSLDLRPEELAVLAVRSAIEIAEGRGLDDLPNPPENTLEVRESTTR